MIHTATVQDVDAELGICTVTLDGDPSQTNIPAIQMQGPIPGLQQKVIVDIEDGRGVMRGMVGGEQRTLGYASTYSPQSSGLSTAVDLTDLEVEFAVTAPGRLIKITGQTQVSAAVANSSGIGGIVMDDNDGVYVAVGRWGRNSMTPATPGEMWSGFVLVPSPDPGIYSAKLNLTVAGGFTAERAGANPGTILVEDVGADTEASYS